MAIDPHDNSHDRKMRNMAPPRPTVIIRNNLDLRHVMAGHHRTTPPINLDFRCLNATDWAEVLDLLYNHTAALEMALGGRGSTPVGGTEVPTDTHDNGPDATATASPPPTPSVLSPAGSPPAGMTTTPLVYPPQAGLAGPLDAMPDFLATIPTVSRTRRTLAQQQASSLSAPSSVADWVAAQAQTTTTTTATERSARLVTVTTPSRPRSYLPPGTVSPLPAADYSRSSSPSPSRGPVTQAEFAMFRKARPTSPTTKHTFEDILGEDL